MINEMDILEASMGVMTTTVELCEDKIKQIKESSRSKEYKQGAIEAYEDLIVRMKRSIQILNTKNLLDLPKDVKIEGMKSLDLGETTLRYYKIGDK